MEIAVVGAVDVLRGTQEALRAAVNRVYVPHRAQAIGPRPMLSLHIPCRRGQMLVNGQPALYVCRNFVPSADHRSGGTPRLARCGPQQAAAATSAQKVLSGSLQPGHATAQGTAAYAARHIHAASGPGRWPMDSVRSVRRV
ncbi:MAG: hypothetical protein MRJ92_10415 [Nitrospira sp.]|nr:hypothetical protein [Nitrospira sp.]